MQFNILVGNHGEIRYLEHLAPLVNYLRAALGACDHSVTVVPDTWQRNAVNLLIENFTNVDYWVDELRNLRRKGFRVGVIATELMVNDTIPYARSGILIEGSADEKQKTLYVDQRIETLNAIAGEVDFMWSFLDRTADAYRGRCPLSLHFPVGYAGGVPRELRASPRDLDIVFFGAMTPHRSAVLEKVKALPGLKVTVVGRGTESGVMPSYLLASLIDRAKIGLNLTLSSVDESPPGTDPRFASCIRVAQMLERETCVVSEEIPLDNPYKGYMISSAIAEIPATCLDLLRTGEWRERGTRHAELFKDEMDARKTCAPVIDETLKRLAMA